MSTLLELGTNIEHRVAAWHRVPHLNVIVIMIMMKRVTVMVLPHQWRPEWTPNRAEACTVQFAAQARSPDSVSLFRECDLPASIVVCSARPSAKSRQSSCRQHSKVIWAGKVDNDVILSGTKAMLMQEWSQTSLTLVKSTYHIVQHNCFEKNNFIGLKVVTNI